MYDCDIRNTHTNVRMVLVCSRCQTIAYHAPSTDIDILPESKLAGVVLHVLPYFHRLLQEDSSLY